MDTGSPTDYDHERASYAAPVSKDTEGRVEVILNKRQGSDNVGSEWSNYKTVFRLGSDEDIFEPDTNDFRPTSTLPLADEDGNSVGAYDDRGTWTGKFDFLLSLLGYSVGLGNVWRFPYMAYSNGGGAFLIPFICMLFLVGFPLMFMELAFGQYASLGPIAIFERFCPLFQGIGYGMVIVSSIVALYYNMIIAWTLFYMFSSWTSELPWERCHEKWSSQHCYSYKDADACKVRNLTYFNKTCFNQTSVDHLGIHPMTNSFKRSPAEEYFKNYVLNLSRGIEEMGEIRWQLALCLLAAWIIVFLCLCKGVQSSGKVVYFTALFPYSVLIILFFRGITLPGAKEGIIFYLSPDFTRLKTAKVWCDAAVQIFFSLSPAWGGLITLASYNKFHNNCFKDALIVSCSNICTSIFAGFVIFSIVGYLAKELGKDVGDVVVEGAGLAFIVYPEVVTRLPISPLWSFLFFFMLLTLGLDSQFALLETVTTAILDRFPWLRGHKPWVVLIMCIIGYLGGLSICTRGGFYVLQLMDTYAASWSVFVLAIMESVVVAWVYGAHRFMRDIEVMIGQHGMVWHRFFFAFWKFLSPATLVYKPMKVESYVYPLWAEVFGWVLSLAPLTAVPILMVKQVVGAPADLSFLQKLKHLRKPTSTWGPAHQICSVEGQDSHAMRTIHGPEGKKLGSFDNPSFTMAVPYEHNQPAL